MADEVKPEPCRHIKETPHGTLVSVNPFSGVCLECGKQVSVPHHDYYPIKSPDMKGAKDA